MSFSEEKYGYVLVTWGGFYNEVYKSQHGFESGSFFFETKEDLNLYLEKLKKIEKELNAYHLATRIEEGENVRYETIAKMILVYEGVEYPYRENFGFAYPVESAHFMFEEGNYSCDCNLSLFIRRTHGEVIEELECGHEIEIKDFEVIQVKKVLPIDN